MLYVECRYNKTGMETGMEKFSQTKLGLETNKYFDRICQLNAIVSELTCKDCGQLKNLLPQTTRITAS